MNRRIIFINQNNNFRLMMLFEHASQIQKCSGILNCIQPIRLHSRQIVLFHRVKTGAYKEFIMSHVFIANNIFDCFKCTCPIRKFCVFKGKRNHWESTLKLLIPLAAGPNIFISEINGGIFFSLFKKALEHINGQGFTKSSRSCKQDYRYLIINQITNQKCFINIVTVFYYIHV